jgi:pimeloyl-ACP methyl ester carboxylesterase
VSPVAHSGEQFVRANRIDICYEAFGAADAEPMLLIMGLGAQMVLWDDAFCEQLAARGFRVSFASTIATSAGPQNFPAASG